MLQKIPNEDEYKFISDCDYDKYNGEINSEELYMNMESFIKCKTCGRLWFFWNGLDKDPQEYIPNSIR
jgi:hypothetical protein